MTLADANTITVSGTDSWGNPISKTLLLDGDMLPADFEESIGFDPLDADSDWTQWYGNQADNGIIDGYEHSFNGLPVFVKYRIGADPFAFDSDGDWLLDDFELMHLALTTSVCSSDSDGNGILDRDEDPDDDGLSNYEEQTYGTEPLMADTDDDALPDREEISLGTDPCNADTDGDGILDGYEVTLGTGLLNNDTAVLGTLDGEEDYWSTGHYINETLNLTVHGRGYAIANASVPRLTSPILCERMSSSARSTISGSAMVSTTER